ncbi:MAG: hypothetical protein IT314_12190 [Anaerolineales bacterium]|nr:hypothetical protein [Anaerolineales bacterium]
MPSLIEGILAHLRGHSLVESVRVVDYDETPAGNLEIKIRCRLHGKYQFQVWLYTEETSADYSYQLFTDQPLLRWDNSPHYPNISTAPHHFHNENNKVSRSPLSGETLKDLPTVLAEIEKWLAREMGS